MQSWIIHPADIIKSRHSCGGLKVAYTQLPSLDEHTTTIRFSNVLNIHLLFFTQEHSFKHYVYYMYVGWKI